MPGVASRRDAQHGGHLLLHAIGAGTVRLVDHEHVGDLHHSCLEGLNVVAHAGDEQQGGGIGQARDLDFVLAHAHSLDQHHLAAGRLEDSHDVVRGGGKAAELSARGHAADVNALVAREALHADAVAEDGPA